MLVTVLKGILDITCIEIVHNSRVRTWAQVQLPSRLQTSCDYRLDYTKLTSCVSDGGFAGGSDDVESSH